MMIASSSVHYATATATAAAAATSATETIKTIDQQWNQSSHLLAPWLAECHPDDPLHQEHNKNEQQMYVNLSTFWYCFLALITTVGLLISLISNMVIIYLFTR